MAQLTVRDMTQRAFESVGVLVVGQAVDGRKLSYALGVLNELLDKWTSDGITHGLSDVEASTVIYDGALASCLRKHLAIEVSGPFGGLVPGTMLRESVSELASLMPLDSEVQYDSALNSRRGTFNIESGYQ